MYVHNIHILLFLLYVIHSVKHLPIHNNNTIHISHTLSIQIVARNCLQALMAGRIDLFTPYLYTNLTGWLHLSIYLSIHAWLSIFMALPLLHTIMSLSMPLKLTQNHGFYFQEIVSPKDL